MKQGQTVNLLAVALFWIASTASPLVLANDEEQPLFDQAPAVQNLESERGGDNTTTTIHTIENTNRLTGDMQGADVTNTITGDNVISSGALANTQGMPMVIQNSGNNVLIQNSTIMNVEVK